MGRKRKLRRKSLRDPNFNLVSFRIPIDLAVTLRNRGINLKEACKRFLMKLCTEKEHDCPLSPNNAAFKEKARCSGRDLNPRLRLERPEYLTGLYYRSTDRQIYGFGIMHLPAGFV